MLNDDESVSVMINEEDHIRIQALGTDLSLKDLYQRASKIDDELDKALDISYDEHLGYLTTCPTNIGTGMRASVMLHLPGLSIMKRMKELHKQLIVLDLQFEVYTEKGHKYMVTFIRFQTNLH